MIPPFMCVMMRDCPVCPSSPLFANLQQVDWITGEECKKLSGICGVVRVQSVKSPEVVLQTATVLRRYGFKEAAKLLTGKHSQPSSVSLCYFALQHPFIV